jgi:hypothetical protein
MDSLFKTSLHPSLRLSLIGLAAAMAAVSADADVQILGEPGTNYLTIQAAVDAAAEGDTLLLAGEVYDGFVIDGKGLTLIALPGVDHEIRGQVLVRNLPANSTVRMDGLVIRGRQFIGFIQNETALQLDLNMGPVRLFGCDILGGSGPDDQLEDSYADGGHGVHLSGSLNVAFLDCELRGGNGAGVIGSFGNTGGAGGRGVWAENSAVALYDSRCLGGDGGTEGSNAGDGGDGYRAEGIGLFASGCTFQGGDGGDADDFLGPMAGDGGNGLWVQLKTQARLLDNTYIPGAGGDSDVGPDGDPGLPKFWEGGVLDDVAGSRRSLTVAQSFIGDGNDFQLRYDGEPGDTVFLALGGAPAFDFVASPPGVRLVKFPTHLPWQASIQGGSTSLRPGIQVGPSGSVDFNWSTQELGAGAWRSLTAQAHVIPAGGGRAIGGAVLLTTMDDEGSPDCNSNGRVDLFDIALGLEVDCNGDFKLDNCIVLTDCNSNGVDDLVDLDCGVSEDQNGNGILDECEAVVVHVNVNAAPGGNGSLAAPFDNLSDAFDLAIDGWTIKVADGVYSGPENRDLQFSARSLNVLSLGGSGACTIDLQQSGSAFIASGAGADIHITGFTIKNGLGASNPGGLLVDHGVTVTLEDCLFRNCRSPIGGALRSAGDTVIIDCVFENNKAILLSGTSRGGAIHASGELRVSGTSFGGNSADVGGAVHYSGFPTQNLFAHCIFRNNTAKTMGGALYQDKGRVRVDNSLLSNNSVTDGGGGAIWIGQFAPASMMVTNSTLVDNDAGAGTGTLDGGGACYVTEDGWIRFWNSILWDNTGAVGPSIKLDGSSHSNATVIVDYCDLQGGLSGIDVTHGVALGGNVILDQDPLFVNASIGDYRLGAGSVCIDAGDNLLLEEDDMDIDGDNNTNEIVPLDLIGNPRQVDDPSAPNTGSGQNPIADMGGLERQP